MTASGVPMDEPPRNGVIEGGGEVVYDPDSEAYDMTHIQAIKDAHESRLMAIPGVQGVGVGQNEIGDDVILVYLKDEAAKGRVPDRLEDVPVETTIVGDIDAY